MSYDCFNPWIVLQQIEKKENFSTFSDFSSTPESSIYTERAKELTRKKTEIREKYHACQALRYAPDYVSFSESTRNAEKAAYQRMDAELIAIDKELNALEQAMETPDETDQKSQIQTA